MPNLVERLVFDFHFSCYTSESVDGKCRIHISSDWKGGTPGVSEIRYRLSGVNPLTGQPLPENTFCGRFTATDTERTSNLLSLNGDFPLRFDAVMMNGEIIRDFREPFTVSLSCDAGRPTLQYRLSPAGNGWTRFSMDCNCAKAVSGKLWLFAEGRLHFLPPFRGESLTCYLPGRCDDALLNAPVNIRCEKI